MKQFYDESGVTPRIDVRLCDGAANDGWRGLFAEGGWVAAAAVVDVNFDEDDDLFHDVFLMMREYSS